MKQKFDVTGMSCSACSAHVEKAVSKVPGIDQVQVNLLQNSMVVEYAKGAADAQKIIQAVVEAGYGASVKGETTPGKTNAVQKKAADDTRAMKRRLGWSVAFLIVLMYVSMGHMLGWPLPGLLTDHENVMVFALTQFLLTLPVMYLNRKYFENGFKTLAHGAPNMDTLVAMGSTAAAVYSISQLFVMGYAMGHGDTGLAHDCAMNLYFEAAAMILALVTIGKYMETRSRSRTSDAITKLMDLAPKTALVLRDGQEMEIPSEEVRVGETVIVKPGQSIPVDGTLLEGTGTVDESAITGESIPVEKKAGDRLTGATVNRAGYFRMQADRIGEDTTLSQIIRLVEEAGDCQAGRPSQRNLCSDSADDCSADDCGMAAAGTELQLCAGIGNCGAGDLLSLRTWPCDANGYHGGDRKRGRTGDSDQIRRESGDGTSGGYHCP